MFFTSKIQVLLTFSAFLFMMNTSAQTLNQVLSREDLEPRALVDTLNKVSNGLYFRDTEKSRLFGQEALRRAQDLNYQYGVGAAYNNIAITYDIEGSRDSSKTYFSKFYQVSKETGDVKKIGAALNNLGMWNWNGGLFDDALSYYFQALTLAEEQEDGNLEAIAFNNIGLIYQELLDFEKALDYHKKALFIRQEEGLDRFVVHSANNLGICYKSLSQFDSARVYYAIGLEIARRIDDQNSIADITQNLAVIASDQGNHERALELSKQALNYQNSKIGQLTGYSTMSQIYLSLNDPSNSIEAANKALSLLAELDNVAHRRDTYETLAIAYTLQGNLDSTVHYYQKLIVLKDTIFSNASIDAYNQFEAKYESEKKAQQITVQEAQLAEQATQLRLNLIMIAGLVVLVIMIVAVALLNQSRTKRKQELLLKAAELQVKEAQIESAIASQEQERKRFARDLHDGFGQFISVLNLNLKSLEKGAKNPTEVFESSAKVLDQMYRELKGICFNLMPETLIKQGIANGIKEFSDRINVTGRVSIEVDTFDMDERLEDLQEISLYRITQEWVNNILKYSNATKINIQLTRDESEITLMIEDNGNGFDQSLLTSGKGNGWKNLNSRANLIKGELELDTTVGIKGSTLILNCPVKQAQEQVSLV